MAKSQKRSFVQNLGLQNVRTDLRTPVDTSGMYTSAVGSLMGALQYESNQRNQLEKEYRDGIVQGKFAPDMAQDVENMLSDLSKIGNSNSKEYKSLLSVANAKLLGDVGRQKSITDYTAKVEDNFERNPDNKFFKKENVFANVNSVSDNKYDKNGKLIKRGLDTDLNEIESEYKKSLRDVKNINADIVVEDFGETLGTISSEWIKANEQETDDDAILKGTKKSGASQRKSGYKYDTSKGYSVPKFTTADEVPDEWVEKFYTRNTAASALMDDYVAKNASKFGSGPDAEMKAKKEFMLNNVLGRLIPDYVGKSANEVDLNRNPGYSGGGGSGSSGAGAELVVTTLAKVFGRDEDIISEDQEATTYFTPKGDAVNVFDVTENFRSIAFGKRAGTDDPLTPTNVYVTSDPLEDDGENTIFVELPGGDVRQYSQKDFTTLMTDISQSGMNAYDLDDIKKTKYWNNQTNQFDLSDIDVVRNKRGEGIEDSEITKIYDKNTNDIASNLIKVELGYKNGLKDLQPSDIAQNNNTNANVTKALQGLVGRRTNRKDKGTEITKIEATRYPFSKNVILITYANGDEQPLSVDEFKEKFKSIDDL